MCGAQLTSNVSARSAIFFAWWKPFQMTSTEATSIPLASRNGPEATAPVEVLAGADRHRRDVADVRERARVEEVDFEPEQVERLERARDTGDALGLEVEVEVDDRPRRAAGALGERVEQTHERLRDLLGPERPASLAEPGHQHLRLVARDDDVGLERRVARSTTSRPSAATSS